MESACDSEYPLVSVIMPVRNEAGWIARSVRAVLQQDYPAQRMEILIADGESDDATVAILLSLPGAERLKIIPNARRIQAAGINRALEAARGEVIVRVDGHTLIAPDYVRGCVAALRRSGAQNVGGSINPVGTTWMGQVIAAACKSPFAVPSAFRVRTKPGYVDTVYMGAWPRRVFEQLDPFDEKLAVNEDYEFNYRLRKAGGKIYFSPDLCSAYQGQQTLRALARRYFRYGFWKVRTLQKHPASLRARQIAAPLLTMYLLAGSLLSLEFHALASFWLAGLTAYGLANLLFSLQSARRCQARWPICIPLVFFTIHAAWGLGFWAGMLRLLRPISPRAPSPS